VLISGFLPANLVTVTGIPKQAGRADKKINSDLLRRALNSPQNREQRRVKDETAMEKWRNGVMEEWSDRVME